MRWIATLLLMSAALAPWQAQACEPAQMLPSVGEGLEETLCPVVVAKNPDPTMIFNGLFSGLDGPEPEDVRRLGMVLNGFEREMIEPRGKMDLEANSLVETLSENRGLVVAIRGTLLMQQFPLQDIRQWCDWRSDRQQRVDARRLARITAVDEAAECGLSD